MRFTKPKKTRIPKESRSLPYKVRGDEKLWTCCNCGFKCDEDRDDSSGLTAGDNHTVNSSPSFGGDGSVIIPTEIGKEYVLMEQDAAGDNKVIYHDHLTDVTKGCPFCGTTNYKG